MQNNLSIPKSALKLMMRLSVVVLFFCVQMQLKAQQLVNITVKVTETFNNYDCCNDAIGICGFTNDFPEPVWKIRVRPGTVPTFAPWATIFSSTCGTRSWDRTIGEFNGICEDRVIFETESWESDGCGPEEEFNEDGLCGVVNSDDNHSNIQQFNRIFLGGGPGTKVFPLPLSNGYSITASVTWSRVGLNIITAANRSVCRGERAVLTAANNDPDVNVIAFRWYNDPGLLDLAFTGNPYTTLNIFADRSFWVTGVLEGGCETNPKKVDVTVVDRPVRPQANDVKTCVNGTAKLSARSPIVGGIFTWYDDALGNVPVASGPNFLTPPLAAPRSYWVGVQDPAGGCPSALREVKVTLDLDVAAPIVNNAIICEGQEATLTATSANGGDIKWYADDTLGNLLFVGSVFNVSPTTNTTYYLVENVNGCVSSTASSTVTVNPTPPQPPIGQVNICSNNGLVILTSTPPVGYTTNWYENGVLRTNNSNSISYNFASVNSAFVVLDYSYVDITTGCEGPKNNFYIIPYPPVEAPTAPNIALCLNEAGTIIANGSNTATSIRWYQSDATTVIETDAGNTGSLSVAASADAGTTTYYVSALSVNGCESPRMRVDVIRGGGAPTGAPVAGNVAICEGERAVLTATGTVGGAMYWYSDAALTNLVFIGNPYETLPLTTNTSFWVAEGAGSCGASAATKVDVVVRPPANLPFATQDYSICVGQVIPSGEGLSATCSDAGVGGTATTMISGTASFPIAIGPDGGVGGVVNFNANSIPAGSTITSVVLNATLAHTWAEDVILDLTSPSGTTINIVDGNAGNDNYGTTGTTPLTYTFTDAASTFVLGTVGNNDIPSGSYLPNEPFSTFDGLNASGNWSLSVDDGFDDDGGSMTSATLTINYQLPADAGSLTWWDAPVGGAQVGEGAPFVPVDYDLLPIGSTTFWAQCDETSTCGNKRVAVKFNVLPAIAAPLVSGDDAVCVGNQANMSVSNPYSNVLWYGNEELTMLLGTGASFTSAPLTETTTFYVVNDNGLCASTPTQFTVAVNPLPTFELFADPGPSFFSGNIEICEGTVVNLEVVLEDPDNQIALLYTEEEPSNLLVDWLIRSQDLMEINTWSDMIYYVRVLDLTTGCFSKPVPIYIDVFNRPTDIEVRGATVCVNEPATIHADVSTLFDNPQPNDQVVVIWADEDGIILDVQDIPTGTTTFNSELNVGSFSDPGTYNFIATTQNSVGCTGVPQIVTVVVNPLPNTPRVVNDTVCAGETATLRAVSTEGVIHWYNSSVSQNVLQVGAVFVIPQANGSNVFWTSVVNENGCESARVPVGVTVNATPDAPEVAQESITICLGQTATYEIVDPNPDLIYVWSTDPLLVDVWGTGEVFETPALSQYTAFYVTAIDPVTGCRSEPTAAWVFVDNTLVISSATAEPVCEGEDVLIKVATWDIEGVVGLFDWDFNLIDIAFLPDGDLGVGNEEWIADFAIPDLPAGDYIFYALELGNVLYPCGSIPVSIPVTVNPLPDAPSVTGAEVCEGERGQLSATSTEGEIRWYSQANGGDILNVGSILNIPVANETTSFWASVINSNGCESSRISVTLTVNPKPETPEIDDVTACYGTPTDLEVTNVDPNLDYEWATDPDFVYSFGLGDGTFTTGGLFQNTTYYVRAVDSETGCVSDAVGVRVFVDNTLIISSATSELVCEGEEALIQVATWDGVSTVGLFDWNLDLIDLAFLPDDDTLEDNSPWVADFLIPDLLAGEYIFYVQEVGEDLFPCGSIPISVLVKVLAGPEKPVATNDSPTCEGGNVIVSAMGGTGSVYSWSGPYGFTSNAQTFEIKNAKSKDAGDYIVTIYNQSGCSASDTTTVVVNPAPALGEGQNPDYVKPVCEHDTLKLSVGSVEGVTYSWTGPDGFTSSEQNPMIANVTEADNQGFYTVVLTDAVTGCASKPYALLVNIDKKPDNVIAVNDGPKCTGEDINLSTGFVFGAKYTWSGPNEYTFKDTNRAVIENINAQSAGVYTVVVQVGACTSEPATTEVVVYPNPIADAGQDDTTEHGMAIQLNGSGGITYQWSPNEYLTPSNNVPNPFVNPPVGSNVYTLKVWNEYGCSDEDDVTIVVVPTDKLIIPEVITPNGDGNNDTWVIGFLGDIAGGYELSIYSRDGARLYSTQDYKNDWNGTYDGEELPDGTYWYVIRTTDRTYKGAVTIRR